MDTKALIEAVKLFPPLYSKQDSSGINQDQKQIIWEQISAKMNQPPEKCKAKWRNLRDSYQKAIKWKHELEELGKIDHYQGYKHEAALNFLEINLKRKGKDDDKRLKTSKRVRVEVQEAVFDNESQEYAQATDYLEEIDSQNDNDADQETEEVFVGRDYEEQSHELITEETVTELKPENQVMSEEKFVCYETATNDDTASLQHEEVPYQESYINESQASSSLEIDSWLSGVKETLMSFPKLLRARAKKQINDLVSDFEIQYLESLDVDRR